MTQFVCIVPPTGAPRLVNSSFDMQDLHDSGSYRGSDVVHKVGERYVVGRVWRARELSAQDDIAIMELVAERFPFAPQPGELARVTEPPPNEITIARLVVQRSATEFLIEDTDGQHWAVVPRGHDGQLETEPRWYAATRISP